MSTIQIESERSEKKSKNTINSKILNSKKNSLISQSKSELSKKGKKNESEHLSDASFSFSNPSDIDSLYENISNKSSENNDFVYESTLPNAKEDINIEIDLQFKKMAQNVPGFDEDVKLMSSNYYKSLVNSITGGKNQNQQQTLEKTLNANTKYGSISNVDDQTIRLKNDLSGVPVMIGPDVTNITGNIDLSDKKRFGESNDNEFILKDSKFSKEESLSGINSKHKLDYKKTMSLEYSKEKDSDKKEMISSSSQNKQSTNKRESKSSKLMIMEDQK